MPIFRLKFANSKPLGSHTYITSSVGEYGQHKLHDTALVQTLLNSGHAHATSLLARFPSVKVRLNYAHHIR
jgi:hypothetical protein